MSAADLFSTLSAISGIIPVLAALYNYRQLDKVLKIASLYFLASLLSDLLLQVTKRIEALHMANNWPLIHIYIVVSILLLAAMYYYAFFNPLIKKIIVIITSFVLAVVLVNIIFIEGLWDYPSISNTTLCVMVICFSLAYFYQLLTRQEFVHIEKQGLFWINAGMLFYFSTNIFLFMLFKRILLAHLEDYYMINNVTNIISNILFTVGLLCRPQKVT